MACFFFFFFVNKPICECWCHQNATRGKLEMNQHMEMIVFVLVETGGWYLLSGTVCMGNEWFLSQMRSLADRHFK